MVNRDAIVILLEANPGLTATEIARETGAERREVARTLETLRGELEQDSFYRWWTPDSIPEDGLAEDPTVGSSTGETTPAGDLLKRLSGYYLDCLAEEGAGGAGVWAASKFGPKLEYVELASNPLVEDRDEINSVAVADLITRMQKKGQRSYFLGYPVYARRVNLRAGGTSYRLEPLLLTPLVVDGGGFSLSHGAPYLNLTALGSILGAKAFEVLEEAVRMSEDLGLDRIGVQRPELDELIARLRHQRDDWVWRDEPDPYDVAPGTPLAEVAAQGIYNRAIIVATDQPKYTQGLESDLEQLGRIDPMLLKGTALGAWLSEIPRKPAGQPDMPLLEPLPLNSEQRLAVRHALTDSLTVITGPPGTGKSQVVSSLLINAARRDMSVLFASKNHKAVDVVEERVNALGPRPVLLRLGRGDNQQRLGEYLTALLGANATSGDRAQFESLERDQKALRRRLDALNQDLERTVQMRNAVDRVEQAAEPARGQLGQQLFAEAPSISVRNARTSLQALRNGLQRATRSQQPAFVRMMWFAVANRRLSAFRQLAATSSTLFDDLAMEAPPVVEASLEGWPEYLVEADESIVAIETASAYFEALDELKRAPDPESIAADRSGIQSDLSENSIDLWRSWLALQPARLSKDDRQLLADFAAVLALISSGKPPRAVFAQYYQLFPRVIRFLPCWAVTSLSVRSQVAWKPAMFDLVVIDEASQCDIASALPLLYRAKRAVIIGDPQQLRHVSTLPQAKDVKLLDKHGLLDHPAWSYSVRSLFDLAASRAGSEDIITLRDHHRSHPDVIAFSNQEFYEGRLRVATRFDDLRLIDPTKPAVRWIDIRGTVTRPATGSAFNAPEAAAVVDELRRLAVQRYRGTIGVVTPFNAQAGRIRDLVEQQDDLLPFLDNADFQATTVHRFQGDERDVMIFSPVISKGTHSGAVRFLEGSPNLFNVAITRARAALVVVGDRSAAANFGVGYLSRFASYVAATEQSATDAGDVFPQIGCQKSLPSPGVSEWEHILCEALEAAGIETHGQYPVEAYQLDLALIQEDRRLDIEVDGEHYHREWDGELARRDQLRNQRLIALGWDVMRFWVYQVRDDLDACVDRVRRWVDEGSP